MRFVKAEELKAGMRLARPIYNKNGVLLYERDTKLTMQGIYSIRNFGLIGIYILEPAEPLPPMSLEDIEFERFQTMAIFTLKDALKAIATGKKAMSLGKLARDIVRSFGNVDHKINFMQNLRSPEDDVYKHSLNVAILSALMSNRLQFSSIEKENVVTVALVHDIGKLLLSGENQKVKESYVQDNKELLKKSHILGCNLINADYNMEPQVKSIIGQAIRKIDRMDGNKKINSPSADIIQVAYTYDILTSMKVNEEPKSELEAIRYLQEQEEFSPMAVRALIDSVNILSTGVCVELTNGHKGLVLIENKINILRPMILSFRDNQLYDLQYERVYKDMQVKDIMKTMDNRFVIDQELAAEYENVIEQKEKQINNVLTEDLIEDAMGAMFDDNLEDSINEITDMDIPLPEEFDDSDITKQATESLSAEDKEKLEAAKQMKQMAKMKEVRAKSKSSDE